LQYSFSDGVIFPLKLASHGNSVTNKRPFCHTQASTLNFIKENLSNMTPKEIINKTYEKAGGMLNMSSSGELAMIYDRYTT